MAPWRLRGRPPRAPPGGSLRVDVRRADRPVAGWCCPRTPDGSRCAGGRQSLSFVRPDASRCRPVPSLPAVVAARGRSRRGDRRRLPRATGHGLRGSRRVAAGERALGDPGAARGLRRARHLPTAVDRSGVHHSADDGRRAGAAGRRGSGPVRLPGGGAGADRRGDLPRRSAGPARLPGGPALQAGARRLHGRRRRQHDRQPTREGHRHSGRRGRPCLRDLLVRRQSRTTFTGRRWPWPRGCWRCCICCSGGSRRRQGRSSW